MTTDPDLIRDRIERTRDELSADVNALSEKVSPGKAVGRRVDRTRNAMASFKDRIMGTTGNAMSTASDTAGSAVSTTAERVSSAASSTADTIGSMPRTVQRRTEGNPLAAGLIAFGVGWLVASVLPASRREQELAAQATDKLGEQLQPVAEQLQQAASESKENLREPAQQAVESVRSTASDAAG